MPTLWKSKGKTGDYASLANGHALFLYVIYTLATGDSTVQLMLKINIIKHILM